MGVVRERVRARRAAQITGAARRPAGIHGSTRGGQLRPHHGVEFNVPYNTQILAAGAGTETLPERPGLLRLGRRADVPRLYAACDLVVSSSAFGEGFSNALAEGMAAGLPAVATDVGDARRIVGETGRTVPPRDPEALARAVRDLLALPPDDRAAVAADARRRIVTHFSLDRSVAAFDALHRGEDPPAGRS